MANQTFQEWYKKLEALAKDQGLLWLIPTEDDYPRGAFEDGITPEDELQEQTYEAAASR